jgi:Putative zinc-finger
MSSLPFDCADVRDLLPELALGQLTPEDARLVERHVRSCPGCRKELAELEEGAASIALSLRPVDAPSALEHRVLERVALASGRRVAPQAHRRLRRQARRLTGVTVAAAVLAAASAGWAVAERHNAVVVRRATENQLARIQRDFQRTLDTVGSAPSVASLRATPGHSGTGSATIVSIPRQDDLILLIVWLNDADRGPYSVRLETKGGGVLTLGQLTRTTTGALVFPEAHSGFDLSTVQYVTILDGNALPVMTGIVHRAVAPGSH